MHTHLRFGWSIALVAIVAGVATGSAQVAPQRVALTGGRVIPVVGEPINGGTVLIDNGKISAVGKDVEVPYDARVFDVSGKVVMPGMVLAHTWRGLDVPNERRPVTPQLDAFDAIDPSQLFFEDALRLGMTAVHVIQANDTVIGGLGQVVRPIGLTPAEMTIHEGDFLKISVAPRSGADRMVQRATLREALDELGFYLEQLAEQRYEEDLEENDKTLDVMPAEARKRGRTLIRAEDLDDEHRNLLRLRGGEVFVGDETGPKLLDPLGAFVYCEKAMDVGPAVALAKEYGFFDRTVLVLGSECYKAVDELKAAARPVVLEELLHREADPITGEIRTTFVPKVMADAGLLFALTPGDDRSLPESNLAYQAARCVRYGVSRDVALRSITLNPAKAIGLGDRLGSIEPGKDGSVVVLSGDPLDYESRVEWVFIDGIPAYELARDVRMQRLLSSDDETSDVE